MNYIVSKHYYKSSIKFYKLYKLLDEIQSEIFFLRTTNHQYLR